MTEHERHHHTESHSGGQDTALRLDYHSLTIKPSIRHLAFAVEDIDTVIAGLRAHGGELVRELERYEDTHRICYVRCPCSGARSCFCLCPSRVTRARRG